MAVPKKKKTRAKRKSLTILKTTNYTRCSNCDYIIRPHTICKKCGTR